MTLKSAKKESVNPDVEELQSRLAVLEADKKELEEKNAELTARLEIVNTRYQTLISELSMREKAADDVNRIAIKEVNQLIENAQKNADNIIREAQYRADGIVSDAENEKTVSLKIRKELQRQLKSFMQQLDEKND